MFDVRQRPISKWAPKWGHTQIGGPSNGRACHRRFELSDIINAPLDQIDISSSCFSLPDDEYQGCSPTHFAARPTTASDGRRMSINDEVIGGTRMVQHSVKQVADGRHLVLNSVSNPVTQNRIRLFDATSPKPPRLLAAWEQPQPFSEEVRAGVRSLS